MDLNPGFNLVRGKITELSEGHISIAFYGLMGTLKVPLRMLISSKAPAVGDEVELFLSYIRLKDGR